MSNLVLLGAGASYGSKDTFLYSDPSDTTPPPLGNDLFDDLWLRGGEAKLIPSEIQELFKDNFEAGMAEYISHTNGDVMKFQRELALYLAEFSPGVHNSYKKLLKSLNHKRFIFSTLNYDLLFEQSAEALGYRYTYSIEKITGVIRLLKIHGSSNFWPSVPPSMFRGAKMTGVNSRFLESKVIPLKQEDTIKRCIEDTGLSPAIAAYTEGKHISICSDYVKKQYTEWKESVFTSKKIFITGVKPNLNDTHIWGDALGSEKASADIFYYGFDSDIEPFNEWKDTYKKSNAYFIRSDFDNCIEHIMKNRS